MNETTCYGPSCDRPTRTRGLCASHYSQLRRHGPDLRPLRSRRPNGSPPIRCAIPQCDGFSSNRGLCEIHGAALYRYSIMQEDYIELYAKGCANPACDAKTKLQVDHDHSCCPGQDSCGKCIRGMLCGRCNRLAISADLVVRGGEIFQGITEYVKMGTLTLREFQAVQRPKNK